MLSLMPNLTSREAKEAVLRIVEKRNYADYQCYLVLREVRDQEVDTELYEAIKEAIDRREVLNNLFLGLMTTGVVTDEVKEVLAERRV